MPNFSLPISLSPEAPQLIETPALPRAAATGQPPSAAAAPQTPRGTRKEVSAMFNRLLASFARSEAVHQARLDQCWSGPHWHLMGHSTWSVK